MNTKIALKAGLAAVIPVMAAQAYTAADMRVDRNVAYGMYSGLALSMDVYYPEKANGNGVA